jgi:hypothetical protein
VLIIELGSKKIDEDGLLLLLDQQVRDVDSSLLVSKWPVILTSCCFVTLMAWEMAGDQEGWFQAKWVPIVGVVISILIWVWDRVLISGVIPNRDWSRRFSDLCSSFLPNNRPAASLEIVHSSLHRSLEGFPDEEARS